MPKVGGRGIGPALCHPLHHGPDARMKLEYDLYDITNQSPMLDLMIVLRTIRVLWFGVGSR